MLVNMNALLLIKQKIISKSISLLPESMLEQMVSRKRGLVILMYHSTPMVDSGYAYSNPRKSFSMQINYLKKYFEIIDVEEAARVATGVGKCSEERPTVAITFDDGYFNNKEVAFPVLEKTGVPFLIFLCTSLIDGNNKTFMSWDDVCALGLDEIVSYGAHSINHFNLRALHYDDKFTEIMKSKQVIERKTGKEVNVFAYPGGGYDKECVDIVNAEYLFGFKDRVGVPGLFDKNTIPRLSIDARHNDFKAFLVELLKTPFIGGKV